MTTPDALWKGVAAGTSEYNRWVYEQETPDIPTRIETFWTWRLEQ